ncbi:serine hydrolase domain-containing protein [Lactobacillus equicursoris]|uniref:serine hydrolase domain-containing protein n=1 Tax=Lactobacillus equicursoris TaxID=420645 RepID=UPI0005560610|nr:serine hydrolase domain-containing protein [Lactobacillus equicursoris]
MAKLGKKILVVLALVILCLGMLPAHQVGKDQVKAADMQAFVKKLMKKKHIAGSIAVVHNGAVQVVSYGRAKKGLKNGAKNVVYPVASLQKQVTAAMVMQLMAEKQGSSKFFSQDTKISRWYPGLRGASKITVGNLLTHTSGLQIPEIEVDRGVTYSEAGAVNWVVNRLNQASQDAVGTYHYSDVNYILLAGIIRKVTGKSYAANFKKRIVNRLGLRHTFLIGKVPAKYQVAASYDYQNGKNYQNRRYLSKTRLSQLIGAAQLITTPSDYYEFVSSLGTGQLLAPSTYRLMTHLKSKKTRYCSGFYIKKGGKVKLAYGALGGAHYAGYYQLTSDNQNGIVMMINQRSCGEDKLKGIGYQILQKLELNTFSQT